MGRKSETWLAVKGYEGLYEVSNQGRVRSLDRQDRFGRQYKGVVLKPSLTKAGYHSVNLRKEMTPGKRVKVCWLVAEAFIGKRPKGQVVRHGCSGPGDDSVDNLSYGSHRANLSVDLNRDHSFSSKYPGVQWDKSRSKWTVKIRDENGDKQFLGRFECEIKAAEVYKREYDRIEGRSQNLI